MGARGPKPTPTPLRILKGDRKDRIPKKEPKPAAGPVVAPLELSPIAQQEWERIAPILETMGVLTPADTAALAVLCESFAEWAETSSKIRKQGMLTVAGSGGLKLNPLVQANGQARSALLRALSEFGCTPSSRSKVTAVTPDEVDPLEEFRRRRRNA